MGHYVLDEKLASGGMGEVFRARQVGPDGFERVCVVKTMREHHAQEPEFVSLFLEEARVSALLAHPNIAQVYEFGRTSKGYYLALEYVDGCSFEKLISATQAKRGRIPVGHAAALVAQAARALDFAHRLRGADGQLMQLVHRDVTPANLLLSRDGVVKLIDFGIAKSANRPEWTNQRAMRGERLVRGKLSYLAPEQIWGGVVDGRADLFSLGVVWYELVTLQRVVTGRTDVEVLENARAWNVTPVRTLRPDCPRALEAVLERAMERNVNDRFSTGRDLAHAIEAALAEVRVAPTYGQLGALAEKIESPTAPALISASLDSTDDTTTVMPMLDVKRRAPAPHEIPTDLDTADLIEQAEARLKRLSMTTAPSKQTAPARSSVATSATWVGDALRRLGVTLPRAEVVALEDSRGALTLAAHIGWVVVVEPVPAALNKPAGKDIVRRVVEVMSPWNGVLDFVDDRHLRFVFVGPSAQANAVLASLTLKEALEETRPPTALSCRIALGGGHLEVEGDGPLSGTLPANVHELASRAAPNQVVMPTRFANAVNDLVSIRGVDAQTIEVLGRRTISPAAPVVGREDIFGALAQRLAGSGGGRPVLITGPRGSGRTTLGSVLERRAPLQGTSVARAAPARWDLIDVQGGALVELLCRLCEVSPVDQARGLTAALDDLPLSSEERVRVDALVTRVAGAATPSPRAAVEAVRAVMTARPGATDWLVLFDDPDGMDELSSAAFVEWCRAPARHELVVGLTTPAFAKGVAGAQHVPLEPWNATEATTWLTGVLGQPPSLELLDGLLERSGGWPGRMTDWVWLAFDLGLLRARGSGLGLEGDLPKAPQKDSLAQVRVKAVGPRLRRQLEAVTLLEGRATSAQLQRVLPNTGLERLVASRLVAQEQGVFWVMDPDVTLAVQGAFPELPARVRQVRSEPG